MISLTKRAAKRVGELQVKETGSGKLLRISVEKGGCSGFEYRMRFDRKQDADIEVESRGVHILIGSTCAAQLEGSGSGF